MAVYGLPWYETLYGYLLSPSVMWGFASLFVMAYTAAFWGLCGFAAQRLSRKLVKPAKYLLPKRVRQTVILPDEEM